MFGHKLFAPRRHTCPEGTMPLANISFSHVLTCISHCIMYANNHQDGWTSDGLALS